MSKTISFEMGGRTYTLTDEQVLAEARRLIQEGLPEEATRFKRWAVVIDGQAIRPAWLFRTLTGMPHRFLSADLAQAAFKRLGLDIANARALERRQAVRRKPRQYRTRRTTVAAEAPHTILDREIAEIRAFLKGRAEQRPSDERLCDWVQFCYTFELYAEGRDLFALVNEADVNPWYLERTRKLARICSLKAGSNG